MGCHQSGRDSLSYIPRREFGLPNLHTAITRRRCFGISWFGIISIGITAVVRNICLGVPIRGPVPSTQLSPEEEDDPQQEGAAHNQRGGQCRQIPHAGPPFPVEFGPSLSLLVL